MSRIAAWIKKINNEDAWRSEMIPNLQHQKFSLIYVAWARTSKQLSSILSYLSLAWLALMIENLYPLHCLRFTNKINLLLGGPLWSENKKNYRFQRKARYASKFFSLTSLAWLKMIDLQAINQAQKNVKPERKPVENVSRKIRNVFFLDILEWKRFIESGTWQEPGKRIFFLFYKVVDKPQVNNWFCFSASVHRRRMFTKNTKHTEETMNKSASSSHPGIKSFYGLTAPNGWLKRKNLLA